jgi:hypothetical protein
MTDRYEQLADYIASAATSAGITTDDRHAGCHSGRLGVLWRRLARRPTESRGSLPLREHDLVSSGRTEGQGLRQSPRAKFSPLAFRRH